MSQNSISIKKHKNLAGKMEVCAVGELPCTRRLAGRCGYRPLRGETIEPRRKSGAGSGGHTGRPYEKTGGGAVGAACMAARAALPRRMHPVLGGYTIRPYSVDGVPRARRLAGRCGHRPLRGGIINPRWESEAVHRGLCMLRCLPAGYGTRKEPFAPCTHSPLLCPRQLQRGLSNSLPALRLRSAGLLLQGEWKGSIAN